MSHLIEKCLLIYTKISGNSESKTMIIHVNLGNTYKTPNSNPKNPQNKKPASNDSLTPKGGQLKNDKR